MFFLFKVIERLSSFLFQGGQIHSQVIVKVWVRWGCLQSVRDITLHWGFLFIHKWLLVAIKNFSSSLLQVGTTRKWKLIGSIILLPALWEWAFSKSRESDSVSLLITFLTLKSHIERPNLIILRNSSGNSIISGSICPFISLQPTHNVTMSQAKGDLIPQGGHQEQDRRAPREDFKSSRERH